MHKEQRKHSACGFIKFGDVQETRWLLNTVIIRDPELYQSQASSIIDLKFLHVEIPKKSDVESVKYKGTQHFLGYGYPADQLLSEAYELVNFCFSSDFLQPIKLSNKFLQSFRRVSEDRVGDLVQAG